MEGTTILGSETLRLHGNRLTDLQEEAGLSQMAVAYRLGVLWQVVSLWESYQSPDSPRGHPAHEPTASELQDLAREPDCHPSDIFRDYAEALTSEKDEERAAGKASGIRLHGEKLTRMRELGGTAGAVIARPRKT